MTVRDNHFLNAKGNVKLEMYDDSGVYFTKEKKNLVVLAANEIVAEMMSDPSKTIRVTHKDDRGKYEKESDLGKTSLTPNEDGLYEFPLTITPQTTKKVVQGVGSDNQETLIQMEEVRGISKVLSVKIGEEELVLEEDVFLKDAEAGRFEFKTAPKESIELVYQHKENTQVEIIQGTETVTVGIDTWKRAKTPSNSSKEYAVDYEQGKILFASQQEEVKASYDYLKNYGIGFMALGGKPEGHPDYQPVSFSQSDKVLNHMENELDGSRVPVLYPASVEEGKAEIDLITTKTIEEEEGSETVEATEEGNQISLQETEGKKVLRLVKVEKVIDEEGNTEELSLDEDVLLKDPSKGLLEFTEDFAEEDKFNIEYVLQKNSSHLTYQLALAPVVELVSVVHEHAETGEKTNYRIQDRGMKTESGDVWMANANTGILQFSSNPEAGTPVNEKGQITVQYKVNAGKTVKFIADFPKGVPGPLYLEKEEEFTSAGETIFLLGKAIAQNDQGENLVEYVRVNGEDADYTVQSDRRRIEVEDALSGDLITVKYTHSEEEHQVYQVAMFDNKDSAISKMFNISGIGPVTKNTQTGIRITWSVTF